MVSKSVSLELEDLSKIHYMIENGQVSTFSAFVQSSIKNELNRSWLLDMGAK